MFRNRRRTGFTLPEVLVTVAIVAILAAVVVPAVTQQLGKADAPSFNASVAGLRTAVTSFVSDVRRFPGKVDDLQTQPTAATDFDLSGDGAGTGAGTYAPLGTAFTAAVVARWRGPYESSSGSTGVVGVGYGWSTVNALRDSLGYVVLELTIAAGADSSDAQTLDTAVDDGVRTTGLVRWKVGAYPALTPANRVRLFLMSSAR
jgi:prepilin-type N-terminal cleavage/methylation domain-containing protein